MREARTFSPEMFHAIHLDDMIGERRGVIVFGTEMRSDHSTSGLRDTTPEARHSDPILASPFLTYEKRLARDSRWALSEGSRFFEDQSQVQEALRKITRRLNELGISYTIVGGLALFHHGYRRFTEDVDLLVTAESLKLIHEKLEGLGYLPVFPGSKNLRDADLGVKIEFLVTGAYPGDGKPKPVSFPDPVASSCDSDGLSYLNLDALIELKLASGMTSPGRMRDLSDVIELIKVLDLPADYADCLNPYVREKFGELWRNARRRFVRIWRNKILTVNAKSFDDMIAQFRSAVEELEAMKRDGVSLDPNGGTADDYALLVTTDPKVAAKYGMEDETEYWGEDIDGDEVGESPNAT
jgi:hypothetical protein